ncbi:MAG: hypothetical protein EAZ95_04610 [Bacteroidetes bacterium]|nr:MAG: hypothetical protein EAZ95_04610 [Bacteroidota bacterium]
MLPASWHKTAYFCNIILYYMKKTTFALLLFSLCLVHTAFAQQPKNDLQSINLKGKIKSIKTSEYGAKDVFGKPTKDALLQYNIATYNASGNTIEDVVYKVNGEISLKKIHKYNEKGQRTDLSIYYASGVLAGKYVCQYDAKGFLVAEKVYDDKGTQTNRITYKYDSKGNLIEQLTYMADESKEPISEVSKHDEANNIIERVHSMPAISKNKNTLKMEYTPQRDIAKMMQVRQEIATDKVVHRSEYHFEYQLDAKNNWTSQVKFEGESKVVKYIVEREITYYE